VKSNHENLQRFLNFTTTVAVFEHRPCTWESL